MALSTRTVEKRVMSMGKSGCRSNQVFCFFFLFHIHQQLDQIEVQNVKTAERQCGGREGPSVLINMCISQLSCRSAKPKPSLM